MTKKPTERQKKREALKRLDDYFTWSAMNERERMLDIAGTACAIAFVCGFVAALCLWALVSCF